MVEEWKIIGRESLWRTHSDIAYVLTVSWILENRKYINLVLVYTRPRKQLLEQNTNLHDLRAKISVRKGNVKDENLG